MKRLFMGAAILASFLASSSIAAAGVIASESFETGLTPPAVQYSLDEDSFDQGVTGPVSIPNFTFSGFSGIITNGFGGLFPDTTSGTQVAFLQSYHSGGSEIDWALTGLTPGHQYVLSFDDVSSLIYGATPLTVSAFGGTAVNYAPGASFMTQTLDFTPTTADGSINFIGDLEGPNSLTAIDNLTVSSISAVPEPATWAMMLFGLGGLGALLRAHRRASRDLAALAI